MQKLKKLVIIHGVTGAIGSACLAHFAAQENTIVYGISRRAQPYEKFCRDGTLPPKTLICSLRTDLSRETHLAGIVSSFTDVINPSLFEKIVYVHALGIYPFEVDQNGNRFVQHDNDMDGIDDRCQYLTRDLFMNFFREKKFRGLHSFFFGGLADKYKPLAHGSWWKTLDMLKEDIEQQFERFEYLSNYRVSLVNISSVLCPNELISRPFVFTATDANPKFWLQPVDIPPFIESVMKSGQVEYFKEYSLFKKADYFTEDYYEHENFNPRKVAELYK